MTLKEKLIALRKLFSDKRRWTKYTYCRVPTSYNNADRVCYCLAGGLNKVTGRNLDATIAATEVKALGFADSDELFTWNDHEYRTINDVRQRIDQSIANLGKKKKIWTV